MTKYIVTLILMLFSFTLNSQVSSKYSKSIVEADSQYQKENFKVASQLYEKAFAENNNMGMVRDRIKTACCYSMLKNNDSAFFHLRRIVEYGFYYEYDRLLAEKKLDNLHDDPRWAELIKLMKSKMETIREMLERDSKDY